MCCIYVMAHDVMMNDGRVDSYIAGDATLLVIVYFLIQLFISICSLSRSLISSFLMLSMNTTKSRPSVKRPDGSLANP